MYNAFISYRRENGFLMSQVIRDRLEDRGIHCFLDLEELRSGAFNEKLYDMIRESSNFILILSPGALDRCVHEDDWVRKEIIAATKMKKKIIPVLCNGFSWPKELYPQLPEEIQNIENNTGIKSSSDYLSAMIDKLVGFMDDVKAINEYVGTKRYFTENLNAAHKNEIQRIDMAFHSGPSWHWDSDIVSILKQMLQMKIHIRVLINTEQAAMLLAQHMRTKGQRYHRFEDVIADWKVLEAENSKYVEVRLSEIPLLRRYYCVHYTDEKLDTVNVKHYTYANGNIHENFQSIFSVESHYFKLYQSEFEYLWEKAIPTN